MDTLGSDNKSAGDTGEEFSDITALEVIFIIGGWLLIMGGYVGNSYLHYLY